MERRHLTNADKSKIAHFLDQKENEAADACEKIKLCPRVVRRIKKSASDVRDRLRSNALVNFRRLLRAKYTVLDRRVNELVNFLRQQPLPVSLGILQVRSRYIAAELSLTDFKGSRGWVNRFIRHKGIHGCIKVIGKGHRRLNTGYMDRIEQIRLIARDYELKNIYNCDESGLVFTFISVVS